MMTQLKLLTKYVMGSPVKVVNDVASKSYEDDKEGKKLDEEIRYLANYSGVSAPLINNKVGIKVGWNVSMIGISEMQSFIMTAMRLPMIGLKKSLNLH